MADSRESTNYTYSDDTGALYVDDYFYSLNKNLWGILNSKNLKTYVVKKNEPSTLTYIAEKIYADVDYWWFLGMLNGIDDLLYTIPAGTIIFYPPSDLISAYFKELNSLQSTSGFSSPKSSKYINGIFKF